MHTRKTMTALCFLLALGLSPVIQAASHDHSGHNNDHHMMSAQAGSLAAENQELADEVMAIHDEAMAKMTHMYELRLHLEEQEKMEGSAGQDAAIQTAISNLKSAHKQMMQWMRGYKVPKTAEELQTARPYLLQERIKIQQVSTAINASIAEAEALLE